MKQYQFSNCSSLHLSPLSPTDLCPESPEEKPTAACASAEVQKLTGEAAPSQLSYLPEETSTSCTSFSSAGTGKRDLGGGERAGGTAQEQPPAALGHLKDGASLHQCGPEESSLGHGSTFKSVANRTSQLSLQHRGRALTALQHLAGF